MASNNIRRFNSYDQYIVRAEDFDDVQTWLRDRSAAIAEGAFGASVVKGLQVTPNSGLQVAISAGIAINANGRPLILQAQALALLTSPVGNPSCNLVVLRPVDTDDDDIPQPTDPLTMVPLSTIETAEVVVIAGTPSATPQFPAIQAGDVILMGVRLDAAAVAVAATDMLQVKRNVTPKREKRVRMIASDYTIQSDDEIIEVAATGGAVVVIVPTTAEADGQEVSVVKIDATDNEVAVSGQGGETISGQTSQVLDSQWSSLRAYANRTAGAWRMF